ncbi:unnamed protein product, partial [Symbiodinium pilosum]
MQYSDDLVLGGRPASIWLPGEGALGTRMSAYPYAFSSRKLSRSVLGLPLGSGPVVVDVPAPGELIRCEIPTAVTARAAVLVHGLLCSRLDLAHVAEALVAKGFTVVAPEMDDSVSHEEAVSPGGFVGELLNREAGEVQRCEVVRKAVAWLRERGAEQIGLVGHSRGGVTISQLDGDFCRVNIAGFQPPPVNPEETFSLSARRAPMLIICGQDDEVCTRPPLSMEYVQDTVKRLLPEAQTWYPAGVGHFSVLNPGVVAVWQPLLGLAGFLAPEPAGPELSQAVAERVAAFLVDTVDPGFGSTSSDSGVPELDSNTVPRHRDASDFDKQAHGIVKAKLPWKVWSLHELVLAKILIDAFQLRLVDLAAILRVADCVLSAREDEEVVVVLYAGGAHAHCVEEFWRAQSFTSDDLPKRGLVGKDDWEDDEPRGLVLPKYLHDFDLLFPKEQVEEAVPEGADEDD